MATPRADSYSAASGERVSAGLLELSFSEKSIAADGIWSWFSDPRAVCYNGATYVVAVNRFGSVQVYKWVHATNTVTAFTLYAFLETDDHNNAAVHVLPDGRIICFYCKHNDSTGHRYRISTNPEDISAWGAEVVLSTGITLPVCYANPVRLSQDASKLWLFYRSGPGGSADNGLACKTTTDLATWTSQEAIWKNVAGGAITPYYKLISDGAKRVHFVATSRHPVEGQSSIYHFYMELDVSNVPHWYKTDGTEILTALPHSPSTATLVYDGATVRGWIWDIAIGADGHPRILGTRYPANDGTDIRYMHWRWSGLAWIEAEITTAGTGLYSPEVFYAGGICFDSSNPNVGYMSKPNGAYREIQMWRTFDSGQTWVKQYDITEGSSATNARPYSPINHHADMRVVWWRGTYTTFTNYNTSIKGA